MDPIKGAITENVTEAAHEPGRTRIITGLPTFSPEWEAQLKTIIQSIIRELDIAEAATATAAQRAAAAENVRLLRRHFDLSVMQAEMGLPAGTDPEISLLRRRLIEALPETLTVRERAAILERATERGPAEVAEETFRRRLGIAAADAARKTLTMRTMLHEIGKNIGHLGPVAAFLTPGHGSPPVREVQRRESESAQVTVTIPGVDLGIALLHDKASHRPEESQMFFLSKRVGVDQVLDRARLVELRQAEQDAQNKRISRNARDIGGGVIRGILGSTGDP